MRNSLITLVLLLLAVTAFAQTPLYKKITANDGLPSNETHCVYQDKQGFIWVGTDNGIVSYDGQNIKPHLSNGESFSKTVFNITESENGTIWFSTYKSGVFYIKDDVIKSHPKNNLIVKEIGKNIINCIKATDSCIYFSTDGYTKNYYYLTTDTLVRIYYKSTGEKNNVNFKIIAGRILHNTYFIDPLGGFIKPDLNEFDFDIVSAEDLTLASLPYTEHKAILKTNRNSFIISAVDRREFNPKDKQNFILVVKNGKILKKIYVPSTIINFCWTSSNTLLVSTTESGILKVTDIFSKHSIETIFMDVIASSIIEDVDGAFWVSTLKQGLIYIDDWDIEKLSANSYEKIALLDTMVYTLLFNKTVDSGFKNEKRFTNLFNLDIFNGIICITEGTDYTSSISFDSGKTYIKPLHKIHNYTNPIKVVQTIAEWKDTLYITTNTHVLPFNIDSKKVARRYLLWDTSYSYMITNSYIYNDTFWFVSATGLYKKNLFSTYDVKPIPTAINDNIYASCLHKNLLYLISDNKGLVEINLDNNTIQYLSNQPSNMGASSMVYYQKKLWIVSKQGLLLFDLSNRTLHNIKQFERNNVGKTFDFKISQKRALIATESGLYSFNPENLSFNNTNKIILTKVLSKNLNLLKDSTTLTSNKNSLTFSFLGVNYRSSSKPYYKYMLEGYGNDTVSSSNNEIQFVNLPAGKYSFKVWASADNITWSEAPAVFSFTIFPHYTETWWFISLMILAAILVISSIFLLIIRNLKRRNNLQKELIMTEQKALRAQMNPHFTFNALNSIQYFLTDNDRRSATTFLSKFSMLVRKVLYNSSETLITLQEEIETLKLYLELEQLRFGDKINIEVIVDENLYLQEILVPSMIIQPFLENAIWHGIMPKEDGKGKLDLTFSLDKDHLICKIIDDGIGREKSAEIKSQIRKGHKSTGLKNIQERISILNHINDNQIVLSINDLKNADGDAGGTEVIIIFEIDK